MKTSDFITTYENISTEDLGQLKKDLEIQLMYHNAAEGPAYWAEKELHAKVSYMLRSVNEELAKRIQIVDHWAI